ncbi:MAG: hypothetical protein AAF499_14065, partial [Pseudomonadota bacterium]
MQHQPWPVLSLFFSRLGGFEAQSKKCRKWQLQRILEFVSMSNTLFRTLKTVALGVSVALTSVAHADT